MKPLPAVALAVLTLAAVLSALACRSDNGGSATAGVTSTSSTVPPVPTGAPTTTLTLRQTDFKQFLAKELADSGGTVAEDEIVFADLSGDGKEEAVVPVTSGGTMGVFEVYVLSPQGSAVKQILRFNPGTGKLVAQIQDGLLVITEPVYGPDDPNCCPGKLKKTTFRWDGSALSPAETETVDNPDQSKQ